MSTLKTTNVQHPSAVDPAIELDAAGKLWLAGGKILQVVRATDTTLRTTSSTTFVDASISVTITPQKNTSAILLIWTGYFYVPASRYIYPAISDNSNNLISGAEGGLLGAGSAGADAPLAIIGYATPATLSATIYKGRFKVSGGTGTIANNTQTGQLYAIEVSA